MDKITDKVTGLMNGEIKSTNNGILSIKVLIAAVLKIMNRSGIKETNNAGIITINMANQDFKMFRMIYFLSLTQVTVNAVLSMQV